MDLNEYLNKTKRELILDAFNLKLSINEYKSCLVNKEYSLKRLLLDFKSDIAQKTVDNAKLYKNEFERNVAFETAIAQDINCLKLKEEIDELSFIIEKSLILLWGLEKLIDL